MPEIKHLEEEEYDERDQKNKKVFKLQKHKDLLPSEDDQEEEEEKVPQDSFKGVSDIPQQQKIDIFPNRKEFAGEMKDLKIEDTDEDKALQDLLKHGHSKSDLLGPSEHKLEMEEENEINLDLVSTIEFDQQRLQEIEKEMNVGSEVRKSMMFAYEKRCGKCGALKPPRTHHCKYCNHCIVQMDHHCPWVNNCIGKANLKLFVVFLFYVLLTTMATIISVSTSLLQCIKDKDCKTMEQAGIIPLVLISLIMCILFGLFAIVMLHDQITYICKQSSTIDEKQKKYLDPIERKFDAVDLEKIVEEVADKGFNKSPSKSETSEHDGSPEQYAKKILQQRRKDNNKKWKQNLNKVFGTKSFNLTWLLPIQPKFGDLNLEEEL